MNAEQIIASLDQLTIPELRRVLAHAQELDTHYREAQRPDYNPQALATKTYQQEYVKCGKSTCKRCKDGGHGPYWYAYWSENGKTRKQYIGKERPIPSISTTKK
jgi:hypothetical protein